MPKLKELRSITQSCSYVFISADKAMNKWKEGIVFSELKEVIGWIDDKDGTVLVRFGKID
jgi:hypothetical protein